MRRTQYRDHQVELTSEPASSGGWVARAMIVIDDGKTVRKIPIFGRRRTTFDTQRKADSYALELAKLWIDGRLWGGNGCG